MSELAFSVPYSSVGSVFGSEEVAAVAAVLESGGPLAGGPIRAKFESRLAEILGVPYAFTTPSCSSALEIATQLLDLRPGAEVIATPQTYQATLSSLLVRTDVIVRFCDVDPVTLNADPASVAALANDKTAAIFIVHYGGLMADVEAIATVARQYGALLVEDCAHAIGADRGGRAPGSVGDLGCFSFQGTKNISTLGQGGLLTCRDPDLAARVARVRDYEPDATFRPARGMPLHPWAAPTSGAFEHEKNAFTHECIDLRHGGHNGVMSEAAAAVGLVQLDRLDHLVSRRANIADAFDRGISQVEGMRVQSVSHVHRHAHHLYTCFITPGPGIDREGVATALRRRGVEVVLRYFPIHLLPEWRRLGHGPGECPVAERVWFTEQVNLPLYPSLTDDQVALVVESVRASVEELRE